MDYIYLGGINMDNLHYVYKIAMLYLIYIFSASTVFLGVILICSFIIDKEYKIIQKYKDKIKTSKNNHSKLLKKHRVREAK